MTTPREAALAIAELVANGTATLNNIPATITEVGHGRIEQEVSKAVISGAAPMSAALDRIRDALSLPAVDLNTIHEEFSKSVLAQRRALLRAAAQAVTEALLPGLVYRDDIVALLNHMADTNAIFGT